MEETEIKDCLVKIQINGSHGTGFFIEKNKILTCSHVIKDTLETDIKVIFNEKEYSVEILDKKEDPTIDLAILKVEVDNENFLKIDKAASRKDKFLTYGFAEDESGFIERGSVPITFELEGNEKYLMKFKGGQVEEGHSGSPIINLTTNLVCGVINASRNTDSGLGGYGISIEKLNLLDLTKEKKVVDMIDIEIAVKKSDTIEQKGDLIESLVSTILQPENYQIETRLENNGLEIGLLYENTEKNKIYVEFKNYKHDTVKIEAIKNIIGTQAIEGYEKVCLISTTELDKNTNELVSKLKNQQKRDDIFVYTPSNLIGVLESTKTIINYYDFEKPLEKNINFTKNYTRGKTLLIVSEYGYFYVSVIKENDEEVGVVLYHAENGKLIEDTALLSKILSLETSFKDSDFYFIENFREETKNNRKIVPLDINKLEFSNKYLRKLQNIKMKLNHIHKDNLILDDVFVYQDLEIIENDSENKKIFLEISANELEDIDKIHHTIIYGAHASGKSTLSNKLQLKYIEEKYIPITFKGMDIKSNSFHSKQIEKLILKSFKQQYKNVKSKISKLNQLDKDKIILIIDDFQKTKLNTEYKSEFIHNLVNLKYKNIIIFADDTLQLEGTTESKLAESLLEFRHYKILEMGHKVRDNMIKKWVSLGIEREIETRDLILKTREKARVINTTVGYNLVPTYPFYVLALLQAMEANESVLDEHSSYGHYYRFLIMQYLNSDSVMENKDITTINSFISTFAFKCLINKKYEYSEHEFLDFHYKYCYEDKIFTPTFDITDKLIKSTIISKEDGVYKFSQDYLYYYFVAQYFSDNINDIEVIKIIDGMCERLYRVEFANIIMFLMHHSPQTFILDKLLLEAKKIFKEEDEFSFSPYELVNINKSLNQDRLSLEERSIAETRKKEIAEEEHNGHKVARTIDAFDDEETDYREKLKDLSMFQKINLSSKMIEILGEIVKNYSGLNGDIKTKLITEIYKLGLRSNKSIISFIEDNHTLVLEVVENIIEKKNYVSEEQKKKVAGEIIFKSALYYSIDSLKKISKAISSKELTMINNKIFKPNNENMAIELIRQAIQLDFTNGLKIKDVKMIHQKLEKENNTLSDGVLKRLVLEHLYMFDKKISLKQSACSAVGIDSDNAKRQLIENSKK